MQETRQGGAKRKRRACARTPDAHKPRCPASVICPSSRALEWRAFACSLLLWLHKPVFPAGACLQGVCIHVHMQALQPCERGDGHRVSRAARQAHAPLRMGAGARAADGSACAGLSVYVSASMSMTKSQKQSSASRASNGFTKFTVWMWTGQRQGGARYAGRVGNAGQDIAGRQLSAG